MSKKSDAGIIPKTIEHAILESDFDQIRNLLEQGVVSLNEVMRSGYSPLSAVILHQEITPEEKLEIVKLFLEHGADPSFLSKTRSSSFDSKECANLMVKKCEEYIREVTKNILEEIIFTSSEAPISSVEKDVLESNKISFEAAKKVYQEIGNLLQKQQQKQQEAGEKRKVEEDSERREEVFLSQRLAREMSDLQAALTSKSKVSKNCESLMSLIDHSNCNTETSEGWTPLHFVAAFGRADQMERLINLGANINAAAQEGRISVLRCAALSNNSQGNVRFLLRCENLSAENIFDGVSGAIALGKDAVVKDILKSESVIKKIDSVAKARDFVSEWREGVKAIKEISKKTNCVASISEFEKKFVQPKKMKKPNLDFKAAVSAFETESEKEESEKDFAEIARELAEWGSKGGFLQEKLPEGSWEKIFKVLRVETVAEVKAVEEVNAVAEVKAVEEVATSTAKPISSELRADAEPFVPKTSPQNISGTQAAGGLSQVPNRK